MTREHERHRAGRSDRMASQTCTGHRAGAYDDRMGASLGALPSLSAFYDQELTLRACTEKYAWAHGCTADALRGRHLRDVLGETTYREVRGHAERALGGETQHVVLQWSEPTGRRFVRRTTLVPYVVDGEQVGLAVLTDDVEA